jgi:CRISPR-associated protein Cas2
MIYGQKKIVQISYSCESIWSAFHYSVFRCDLTPKGRVEMIAALTDLIKHDLDRIMIVDLGPADGGAMERIEFLGVRAEDSPRKAVIV